MNTNNNYANNYTNKISEPNDQYLRHVGYSDVDANISAYFSDQSINFMSAKVSELLRPIYPNGVIVPTHIIRNLANAIYESYRPSLGDIFTRYSVVSRENYNYVDEMINQVIKVAVDSIRNDLDQRMINSKLTVWSSLLGDFNKEGLRPHDNVKIRKRRPQPMLFNMNY